ncbi:MAG: IS1595 family transposase [Alphaproteobacteria bacterium]|nr:IS1595 family transposase [Alphaproteobacteria bacterium]
MSSELSSPRFHNEVAAYEFVEAHLWPDGPVCPHCQATGDRVGRLAGKTSRAGMRKCYGCRKTFTVKIGSIFESSHVPLHMWLQAIYLICSSKKGISTRQLQRTLGVGMKTAWFLGHRIRFAMEQGEDVPPMGGAGKVVEADETFLTNSPKTKKRPGYNHKIAVLTMAERGGRQRSIKLHRSPNAYEIRNAIKDNLHPDTRLVTDGAQFYKGTLVNHESVDHSAEEWVRGDVHTNSLEGWFSVLKRGMFGTYQNVKGKHLHRYLAEFDFRQNNRERLGVNDKQRAVIALKGAKGKRLTYRTTNSAAPF